MYYLKNKPKGIFDKLPQFLMPFEFKKETDVISKLRAFEANPGYGKWEE
jgi:hypothetical protein